MNPKWSEEEVLLLKDKYSRLTNDELIALFPNKTFLAIYKKAYSLNLKRDEEIEFLNRSKAKVVKMLVIGMAALGKQEKDTFKY